MRMAPGPPCASGPVLRVAGVPGKRTGLVVTWQEDHSREHRAMAKALADAFAANAADIDAQIGRRALDQLLAAHRQWIEWLAEGRVRKLALVAQRSPAAHAGF